MTRACCLWEKLVYASRRQRCAAIDLAVKSILALCLRCKTHWSLDRVELTGVLLGASEPRASRSLLLFTNLFQLQVSLLHLANLSSPCFYPRFPDFLCRDTWSTLPPHVTQTWRISLVSRSYPYLSLRVNAPCLILLLNPDAKDSEACSQRNPWSSSPSLSHHINLPIQPLLLKPPLPSSSRQTQVTPSSTKNQAYTSTQASMATTHRPRIPLQWRRRPIQPTPYVDLTNLLLISFCTNFSRSRSVSVLLTCTVPLSILRPRDHTVVVDPCRSMTGQVE